ncbi:hypothetical protein RI367_006806 [Sorochytrium milnesiophthora]
MAAEEPAASSAAIAVGWLVVACLVVWLLWHFGDRRATPWYVQLIVLVGWLGPFSIVYFLPIDITSAKFRKCQLEACPEPYIYLPASVQLMIWQGIYWTLFALAWFVTPLTQSYCNCGGFTFAQRIKKSAKYNIWYYAGVGVLGMGFLAYLALVRGLVDFQSIRALVMALSNAYGLLLVVMFMSYGLVEIPRFLWYSADIGYSLKELEFRAPRIREDVETSKTRVVAVVKEIASIAKKVPMHDPLRRYVEDLLMECPEAVNAATTERASSSNITLKYLQEVNRKLMSSARARANSIFLWDAVLRRAFYYQDVLENGDNSDRKFHSSLRPLPESRWKGARQRIAWVWHVLVRSQLLRLLSIVCALLSLAVVWSEVVLNVSNPVLSLFGIVLNSESIGYGAIELASLLTITYMCICTYTSLLKIKVFSLYQLVPDHHTDPNSLLFFAAYLARLTFPLCYNYLNLAREEGAMFSQVMGRVNLVPLLGERFNDWLPVTLGVLCFFTVFNVHRRLLRLCNLNTSFFVSNDEEDDVDIEDGRLLIQQARAEQERQLLPGSGRSSAHILPSPQDLTARTKLSPEDLSEIRSTSDSPHGDLLNYRSAHSSAAGARLATNANNLFVPLGRTSFTPRSSTPHSQRSGQLPTSSSSQPPAPSSSTGDLSTKPAAPEESTKPANSWTLATGFTKKLSISMGGDRSRPGTVTNESSRPLPTDAGNNNNNIQSQPVGSLPTSATFSNFTSFQRPSRHNRGSSLSSAADLSSSSAAKAPSSDARAKSSSPAPFSSNPFAGLTGSDSNNRKATAAQPKASASTNSKRGGFFDDD